MAQKGVGRGKDEDAGVGQDTAWKHTRTSSQCAPMLLHNPSGSSAHAHTRQGSPQEEGARAHWREARQAVRGAAAALHCPNPQAPRGAGPGGGEGRRLARSLGMLRAATGCGGGGCGGVGGVAVRGAGGRVQGAQEESACAASAGGAGVVQVHKVLGGEGWGGIEEGVTRPGGTGGEGWGKNRCA